MADRADDELGNALSLGATGNSHRLRAREDITARSPTAAPASLHVQETCAGLEIRIDIQLPFKVSPEELSWAERMVPALALAMIELRRAGGQGREQELIALFAADVVPTLHDVQRAVRQAELVRAKARRAASSESARVRRMMDKGDLLEEAMFIKRLGWSSSRLAKAVAAHRVFFVNHDGKRLYPAFYGDPAYDRRQLYSVTRTLGDLPGQAKLQFFSSPRGSLSKQTPLQALHAGKLASVKSAAKAFAAP